MQLPRMDQRGAIGFVIFIVSFVLFVMFTIVYFEAIVDNTVQETVEEEPAPEIATPQDKGPEVSLPVGTVITYSGNDVLVLLTRDDVALLPQDTPSRFVNYMMNTLPIDLEETKPGCVSAYQISRVSNFNISGSIGEVSAKTKRSNDTCTKGLSVVWYVDQTNWTWVSKNFGVLPLCSELGELPIYTEFIPECQRDTDSATLKNPNGSIKNRQE